MKQDASASSRRAETELRAAVNEAHVDRHIRRQHGLISRSQALNAGMTRHRIQHRVSTGRWRRVAPGVFHLAAHEFTPHSKLLAACIAYDGLASHRAAAALHGIDGFRLGRPEIAVDLARGRSAVGITVHRTPLMELAQPVLRHGIPCTGLPRTLLDLAAVVTGGQLERAVDAALRDRRLRLDDLWTVLATHERRGRDGLSLFRSVLKGHSGEDHVPLSDWSRLVCELLVESGLPRPVMEHRVHQPDGRLLAQVDLAYPDLRVVIELDSVRWHHNRESFVNDRRRSNSLVAAGWTVLAFTWNDYAERSAAMCRTVARALEIAASN
ncbi:MAG: type IV toxin-antitoxin system AbiEi family antitoxin domain-containing protein [Acidimicrobiaceae bacterium]|nr:type IV toxin-antitoxin system AbiEi family antitoxin domain-containing protein [Acidimicrobiaceae bacterium]MDE0498695.1 type IV toxin-antitoxin system AbiEi family antitoxin domain-containing protein [Acidimicrobiaceae bacterium]